MTFETSIYSHEIVEKHYFSFGKVFFLSNILVTEFNEGIVFTYEHAKEFIHQAEAFYGNTDFYYISNRINSYSVNPIDWLKINNKYQNLKAICFVNKNKVGKRFLKVERLFCKHPIKEFNFLHEAVEWINAKEALDRNKNIILNKKLI